ncbi:(d)CMP kinase [Yoonia sediminilitoris]|uniref:Cytidylate kinase n=1 Tax=Yoonia sediminilitoris TaxID=1286148 RepID=A0A2T6KJR5_9RHOB|nr:(d)CMP kinase [Yoonia sediminilitoris]PUB16210.1 cytidylate kinase [Yoonia sediminilitoris]RCW96559.1 cytidylate kinase [Yoonia sediminilitoris]
MTFTVAIDGPAAAGKGTISKAVAARFGFAHLDTGLLYRAVAAKVLAGGDPVDVAHTLDPCDLEDDQLRTAAVAQAASKVAVIADVRSALVDFQRKFAARADGAVLDGRDIGTVICPDAAVKIYVTASAECRAERRYKELLSKGADVTLASVLADVKARDARDSGRAEAPMKPAADAVMLDTSDMTIEDAIARAVEVIERAR